MARENDTCQRAAMRELISGYLKQNNIKDKDSTDVNAIMRDMMRDKLGGISMKKWMSNLTTPNMIIATKKRTFPGDHAHQLRGYGNVNLSFWGKSQNCFTLFTALFYL